MGNWQLLARSYFEMWMSMTVVMTSWDDAIEEPDVERTQAEVDSMYAALLDIEDMEADLALLKIAHLQVRAASLRTRLSRSSTRAAERLVAREIDPLLAMLLSHARLLERAMSIRRHKPR